MIRMCQNLSHNLRLGNRAVSLYPSTALGIPIPIFGSPRWKMQPCRPRLPVTHRDPDSLAPSCFVARGVSVRERNTTCCMQSWRLRKGGPATRSVSCSPSAQHAFVPASFTAWRILGAMVVAGSCLTAGVTWTRNRSTRAVFLRHLPMPS